MGHGEVSPGDGGEGDASQAVRVGAGEIHDRRRDIEDAHGRLVVAARLAVREGDDQRHAEGLVVDLAAVAVEIVLVETLALRSMDDPGDLRAPAPAADGGHELAELPVDEGDLAVVRRGPALEADA